MMFDNDFPLIAKETDMPRSPYDVYKRPDESKEKYGPPPEGFQRPTPVKKAEALGYLQEYVSGMNRYEQGGADIADFGVQANYAQQAGGPLMGQTLIAGSPSFDLAPDIDSPIVDRWIREYDQRNPGKRQPDLNEIRRRMPAIRSRLGIGPA